MQTPNSVSAFPQPHAFPSLTHYIIVDSETTKLRIETHFLRPTEAPPPCSKKQSQRRSSDECNGPRVVLGERTSSSPACCGFGSDCRYVHVCHTELNARLEAAANEAANTLQGGSGRDAAAATCATPCELLASATDTVGSFRTPFGTPQHCVSGCRTASSPLSLPTFFGGSLSSSAHCVLPESLGVLQATATATTTPHRLGSQTEHLRRSQRIFREARDDGSRAAPATFFERSLTDDEGLPSWYNGLVSFTGAPPTSERSVAQEDVVVAPPSRDSVATNRKTPAAAAAIFSSSLRSFSPSGGCCTLVGAPACASARSPSLPSSSCGTSPGAAIRKTHNPYSASPIQFRVV
jgi:hypothetical protein